MANEWEPLGLCCVPCGREISTPSAVSPSLQCSPLPHSRLPSTLRKCIQLHSLCHGEGIFHGLPCLATGDSLGMRCCHCRPFAHGAWWDANTLDRYSGRSLRLLQVIRLVCMNSRCCLLFGASFLPLKCNLYDNSFSTRSR